jgi:hypothetical protein
VSESRIRVNQPGTGSYMKTEQSVDGAGFTVESPGAALVDADGGLVATPNLILTADRAMAGMAVATDRNQQIMARFDQTLVANDVATTTAGGATVGQANGIATLTSTAAVTATARIESNKVLRYSPGREIFMAGTWACSAVPTSADSKVRFGQFTDTDGVWFGYEGPSFAVATRLGGVDTVVLQAAFNGDQLDGSASSKFRQAGTPVAIDFSTINIFRIRWLYYGVGTIVFEVLSPDYAWVIYNTIYRANAAAALTITNTLLPVRSEIVKTAADAQNLVVVQGSWEAGTAESPTAFSIDNVRGHVYKDGVVAAAVNSTLYTVTAGRILMVTNIVISIDNTSAVASGRLDIKDGGALGALKESIRVNSLSSTSFEITYPVPKRILTDLFLDIITGTLAFSASFTGYETIVD